MARVRSFIRPMIRANSYSNLSGPYQDPNLIWELDASRLMLNPSVGTGTPTLTRSGNTATRVNSSGLIEVVNANLPRFDYDPVTLALKGLLIEGARTNVVLWNRDLTNAAWVASNVTVAKDQVGTDGVSNSASSLTATAGNGTVLQTITLASSARFQSAYIKRITGTGTINMTMDNGATWTAVTVTSAWTRVAIPTQTLANPIVGFRIVTSGDAIAVDYVQNENGAFVTSAIPTTTAAVTRNADVCTLATSAIAGFSATEGTISAYGSSIPVAAPAGEFPTIMSLYGDTTHYIAMFKNASSNDIIGGVNNAGIQAFITLGSALPETLQKSSLGYAANNFRGSLNGAAVVTDTAGTVPTVTTVGIGSLAGSITNYWGGHILKARIYSRLLSDAEQPVLTA